MDFVSRHVVENGQINKQQASGGLGFTVYVCPTETASTPSEISVVHFKQSRFSFLYRHTHAHTLWGSQSSFISQTSLKRGRRFGRNVIHNEAGQY